MNAHIAVIGEESLVRAYALAGVLVWPADDADRVRAAWAALGSEVGLVILSAAAAGALAEAVASGERLVTVMK